MLKFNKILAAIVVGFGLFLTTTFTGNFTGNYTVNAADKVIHGDIAIGEVSLRATIGAMTATGGYVTIMNHGSSDDRLIGVATDFASKAEIHMMNNVDGVMQMRKMPDGAPLPAGGMLTLAPGGMHLMFIGIDGALAPGETRPITLIFAKGGAVTVMAHVKKPGDLKKSHGH